MTKFFKSLIPSKGDNQMAQIGNGPPHEDRSAPRHIQPNIKPPRDFSILRPFHGEFDRVAINYKRVQGGAIGSRYTLNRVPIGRWITSKDSSTLPICARSDEATKLTLETVELVDFLIGQSPLNGQDLRIVHLCGEKSNLKRERPTIMILDLLSQVLRWQERSGGQACSSDDLARMELADPKVLWETFWSRVQQLGIQRLFIFLDNIDELILAYGTPSDSLKEALRHLVNNLKLPNSQSHILVKVLITCNSTSTEKMFTCKTNNLDTPSPSRR